VKGTGLQRMQLMPANWFPPPDGNRSRLLLRNEQPSQSGFPCGQQGGTSSFAGGVE
jgi:hypothetical protein